MFTRAKIRPGFYGSSAPLTIGGGLGDILYVERYYIRLHSVVKDFLIKQKAFKVQSLMFKGSRVQEKKAFMVESKS
jgi:hypothetical protein